MKVYLLGVYHNYQLVEDHKFTEFVREFCRLHGILSIAEEMNFTALHDFQRQNSTIKVIADELSLPYAMCDPDEEERRALGILGENQLRYLKWLHEWTDERFASQKALNNAKREEIWLQRLKDVFMDPMLFICGIDHLHSFSSILEINGYSTDVVDKKWAPSGFSR